MDNGKTIITPQINYELLVEEALRAVVRSSLRIAEENGLPGDTHFYITFLTDAPDVEIPVSLRRNHPEKMTIVIQHQYSDLKVEAERFSVTLTFAGTPEKLTIPFAAVVDFNDPSVGFGLQFAAEEDMLPDLGGGVAPDGGLPRADNSAAPFGVAGAHKAAGQNRGSIGGNGGGNNAAATADVVSLDAFRKKT